MKRAAENMTALSRRHFLAGAAGLTGLAVGTGLTGCAPTVAISSDPKVLTLWFWNRSMNPKLLAQAAKGIPGSSSNLRSDVIGGNFNVKLRTSMAGRAYIPDITALNSDVSSYFPIEQQFFDLNDFGAEAHRADFLDWKWNLGVTSTDRLCFWPMDTGPSALWYRNDVFEKAKLPTDPDEVARRIPDWDAWTEAGKQLRTNAKAFLAANNQIVFNAVLNASRERYFAKDGTALYEAPDSAVKKAWDVAVGAARAGITARALTDSAKNSSYNSGQTASNVEAVWWGAVIKSIAPDDSGKWSVAKQPGGAGNSGGSFLCIPKTSKNPQAAFDFMTWATSPANQVKSFTEIQLFPSTPASFDSPAVATTDPYFGDQDTLPIFSTAAAEVPITFISPYEPSVSVGVLNELTNVETQGKDPERAWQDALAQARRQLAKKGLAS